MTEGFDIPPWGFRTVFNCGNILSSVNAQTPDLLKERHHTLWGSCVVFFLDIVKFRTPQGASIGMDLSI